jgi:hypothetical protein
MVILNMYLKSVAAWMSAFAPLWAVVLGYGASVLLAPGQAPPPVRSGLATALFALFAVSGPIPAHRESREARYAVVDVYRTTEPGYHPAIDRIGAGPPGEAALARHFELVPEGGDGLWTPPFRVYRRKTPAPAAGLGSETSGPLQLPG